eukprot:366438-Chlamydomonas_euryale.AAC.21
MRRQPLHWWPPAETRTRGQPLHWCLGQHAASLERAGPAVRSRSTSASTQTLAPGPLVAAARPRGCHTAATARSKSGRSKPPAPPRRQQTSHAQGSSART